jgi:D-tagatose-1,6-bisphosphate aldolase subunit GatZ/KbaZ
MSTFLQELARQRAPAHHKGIYSVCSAHAYVLEAAMRRHVSSPGPLLIEATCNQVNQSGGYTGMKPGDFRNLVHGVASRAGFPVGRILLGGDHLGPFPWQHLPASRAMANAREMVNLFVREGFCKIHLDASMACADDPRPLPDQIIAERAADLCAEAERSSNGAALVYVIGTEVPTPGGAFDEMQVAVTAPEAAERALQLHREAFSRRGLNRVWDRVIALVVQPGVEFTHEAVKDYEPAKAVQLVTLLGQNPGLVFEAHSTDYQRPQGLAALVRDGFVVLKVGPALTYAMRQALFALAAIEAECLPSVQRSRLPERVEEVMLEHPEHWHKHYSGTPEELHRLRIHSYSDRIRYYWAYPQVQESVETLIGNLSQLVIPETLLSDYFPAQYVKFRAGEMVSKPLALILDVIGNALDPYLAACEAR